MRTLFGFTLGYFVYTKSGRDIFKKISERAIEVAKAKITDPDIKIILFGDKK